MVREWLAVRRAGVGAGASRRHPCCAVARVVVVPAALAAPQASTRRAAEVDDKENVHG